MNPIDVTTTANAAFNTGMNVAGIIAVIIIGLAIIGGCIGFMLWRRTFNIDVIIVRFGNGTDFRTGLKGKFILKKNKDGTKEWRFKIYNAKKHKLLYHQESISPENIYHHEIRGRVGKMIYLAENSEGYLVPMEIKPKVYTYTQPVLDDNGKPVKDESGKIKEQTIETHVLKSAYSHVHTAWLSADREKIKQLYKKDDNMLLWMMLLFGFCFAVMVIAILYNGHKTTQAMEQFAIGSQSIADAMRYLGANMTNATQSQPINTVINI